MKIKKIIGTLTAFILLSGNTFSQNKNEVTIIGQMRSAMWKGELEEKINLDTLSNKEHLYGLGPVEFLTGEILIIDGNAYKSTVITDSTMNIEETFAIKAPFFGYANISSWNESRITEQIETIKELEKYIDNKTNSANRPFLFKLTGIVNQAKIHVVNLPPGTVVRSPDDAHQGQINYFLENESVEIIGFFSKFHKTIFTHHDTYLHLHLITTNKEKMGHLDEVSFKKGTLKLYLPAE